MLLLKVNEHVFMRMLSARDALPLYHLIDESRDSLITWLPWLDKINSEEDALQYIKDTILSFQHHHSITAGIWLKEQLVGMIAYYDMDFENRIGHIGYWLGEKYQGRGIMTESVTKMINYGFYDLSLNRIEMRISSDHLVCLRIPRKLGFKEEGCIRQAQLLNGHYVDHIIFGLLRCEWTNSN